MTTQFSDVLITILSELVVEDNYTQHVESSSQGIFWSLQHTWNECEPSDRIP